MDQSTTLPKQYEDAQDFLELMGNRLRRDVRR
jgi:hypothetical protein